MVQPVFLFFVAFLLCAMSSFVTHVCTSDVLDSMSALHVLVQPYDLVLPTDENRKPSEECFVS